MTRTAHDNRRTQRRVPIELIVTLVDDIDQSHTLATEDISTSGVFLSTHDTTPFRLRQIVQVQLEIPDTGEIIYLPAVVIRVIQPKDTAGSEHTSGIGLHLYGLNKTQREGWETFVGRMLDEYHRLFQPEPPVAGRRLEFVVHFKDVVELSTVMTWDFIYGAMILETNRVAPQGTPVRLLLIHPEDHAEFPIPGTVTQLHPTGMSIELDGMTPKHLTLFKEFVELGLPELELDGSCEPAWLVCEDEDDVAA